MPRFEAIYEARRDAACGCQPRLKPKPSGDPGPWPGERRIEAPRSRRSTRDDDRPTRPSLIDLDVGDDDTKGLGGMCRPWLKVERNQKYFEACMAIAEKIGPIDSSKKAFEILKQAAGSEDQEIFGGMYLDTHLYLRGLAETARGEVDAVMAPVKPTLRLAMQDGITGLLIFHCHPTLYSNPSEADKDVTRIFEEACPKVDLFFVDHVIIGGWKEYYSFADHGLLKEIK